MTKKPSTANLGKIGEARLDLVPDLAGCKPGIRPVEYNVIVAPAAATEKQGKIGSIYIPDDAKENLDLAMQVGRIIDQSPLAYDYAVWPDPALKPQVGNLVWFARYAGAVFEGVDGREYRILKDKDIGAVIEEPKRFIVEDLAEAPPLQKPNPFAPGGGPTLQMTGTHNA